MVKVIFDLVTRIVVAAPDYQGGPAGSRKGGLRFLIPGIPCG
jgi:hypothetical protein